MDKKEELTQIVSKVQEDIGQFELLYVHVINKVYFWCYTLVKNEAVAQDLAQESMITIYQKLYMLKSAELFSPWMYTIVRNKCYQYLGSRKRKDRLFLDSNDEVNEFENMIKEKRKENLPKEAYDLQETKQLIKKFVNNLPRRQREVITLYYLEEMKISEIAEILDYKEGSVKSRLHSGRKNLEVQMRKYEEENENKLYCVLLLPVLILTLKEYRKELCARQDLAYNKKVYESLEQANTNNNVSDKNSKRLLAYGSIAIGAIIIVVLFLTTFTTRGDIAGSKILNNAAEDNVKTLDKIHHSSHIESISFISFPTRTSVEVTIQLKKEIMDRDVTVLFEGKEIEFVIRDKEILIQANENGRYETIVEGINVGFNIDVIDEFAPELENVLKKDNYLQLIINDELSQIDYESSYVEYQGNQYKIDSDLKVRGNFEGYIKIRLIKDDKQYITYEFNL